MNQLENGHSQHTPGRKPKSRVKAVLWSVVGIVGLVSIVGAMHPDTTNVNQVAPVRESQKGSQSPLEKSAPTVTSKTETVKESIPFESTVRYDSTRSEGTEYVQQTGKNGTRERTYEITYVDGVEQSRVEVSSTTTQEPVNQITVHGTKKKVQAPTNCTNGTYVNAAGNVVCRPAYSSSAPAGASAQCRDGTYSYSQSRRGTCSHHGGVSRWL